MFLYNRDQSLTEAITSHGYWESWVTAWHVKNIGEGDVYIDLGANAGYYSFLANYLGATVFAFEANQDYCGLISRSSVFNGVKFYIEAVAIADKTGTAHLNLYGDLDGSASIVGDGWDDKFIDVRTAPLDAYSFPAGNMIIKMDIEGAEELAWDGMPKTLAIRKPTIIMEYTPGAYSDKFWDKLTAYGKVSLLDYEGNENLVTKQYAESQTDWITLVVRSR